MTRTREENAEDLSFEEEDEEETIRFNHGVEFNVEIISNDENGDDITPAMYRKAFTDKMNALTDEEFADECNIFDTMEAEEESNT